jgi:hypothetical protein
MKELEFVDAYGHRHRIVRCLRKGWDIWTWSNYYKAWIGDIPTYGRFRTKKEAIEFAKDVVEKSKQIINSKV